MPRVLAVLLLVTTVACRSSQPAANQGAATAAPTGTPVAAAPSAAPQGAADGPGPANGAGDVVRGVVAETMNSGGYTYVRLTNAAGDTWAATAEMPIETGATMAGTVSVVMENFHSRTLNRDFPRIAFVNAVTLNGVAVASNADAAAVASDIGARNGMPPLVGSHGSSAAPTTSSAPSDPGPALVDKVSPAPGGMTVFQVWQKRADLSAKTVVVRGRVVKANYDIMGAHWYHVQDGTGEVEAGTHDLTVTSRDRVSVGDIVTVSGPIALGKDFGAGYAYDVMVDGASLVK